MPESWQDEPLDPRTRTMTTYAVFLSYASADKPAVEALARRLREDGLEPFLDIWHLVPGEPWQEALEGTLRAVGVNALLADYDVLGETGEARTVQEALRLSAHVLARDWGELLGQVLAGQLLGRLGPGGEEARRLLGRATDRALLRPRRVTMSRAGGPLIRTLEGHTQWVYAVAVLDETHVVSASSDHTLRVWDVALGKMMAIIALDAPLWAVTVTADGRTVVAAVRISPFEEVMATSRGPAVRPVRVRRSAPAARYGDGRARGRRARRCCGSALQPIGGRDSRCPFPGSLCQSFTDAFSAVISPCPSLPEWLRGRKGLAEVPAARPRRAGGSAKQERLVTAPDRGLISRPAMAGPERRSVPRSPWEVVDRWSRIRRSPR